MATEFYNRNWRMPKSSNSSKVSNYSMSFDGSSEYITMNDLSSILTNTDFSLSLWFKGTGQSTTADSSNMLFSAHGSGTSNVLRIGIAKSSGGIFFAATGSSGGVVGSADYDDSNWYHLVITKPHVSGGAAGTVYINGSSIGSTEIFNINFESATHYSIGQEYDPTLSPGDFFKGNIDHVAIFDYALSAPQVTALYGNSTDGVGNPMAITGGRKPIAYYPIGDYAAFNGSEYLVNNGALQDYVFDFDNGDKITTSALSNFVTSNITASLWVNYATLPASFVGNPMGATNGGGWNSGFGFLNNGTSGNLRFFIENWDNVPSGTGGFVDNTTTLTTNTWFHLVGTWDGSTVSYYINGVPQGTASYSGSLTTSDIVAIGTNLASTGYNINAMISNAQIFNTAIPATGSNSVETLYNNGTPLSDMSGFTSLQGWWKLDASATFDGSNWSIPDDSSNSNTGTSSGMTAANLVQSDLNITTPYSRYALEFDRASNTQIRIPNSASLELTASHSISFWISPTSQDTFAYIFNKQNLDPSIYYSSGNLQYAAYNLPISGGGTFNIDKTIYSGFHTAFNNNGWVHCCVTLDHLNFLLKFYVNGAEHSSQSIDTRYIGLAHLGNQLRLMGYSDTSHMVSGQLSNVSIWNAALTPTQVTEIYNEGKPSNLNNHSAYSNLSSWWQLGENSSFDGTNWTVLDEKGTNNGTSANMTEADLVNGVGTSANGLSSGMGAADNIVGDAPYSTANAVSYGMGVDALSTDVPS